MTTHRRVGVIFEAKDFYAFRRTLESADSLVRSIDRSIGGMTSKFEGLSGTMGAVFHGTTTIISEAISAGLRAAEIMSDLAAQGLQVAASYEDAFTGVTKTVEGLAEVDSSGFLRLTDAGDALKMTLIGLSDQIPVTFEDLSQIAALGGQLGLAEGLAPEDAQRVLGAFSETIAGLAEATDVTQQRAALDLAQITNIFRNVADSSIQSADDIIDNVDNLGNTLVELGNTSATTEGKILSFAQRISGTAQTVGMSQADMLGIATAFTSMGLTAEAGGSSVIRALIAMQQAASESSDAVVDNNEKINDVIQKIITTEGRIETIEARARQKGIADATTESVLAQMDAWIQAGNAVEDFGTQLGATERRELYNAIQTVGDLRDELDQLRASNGQLVADDSIKQFADVLGVTAEEFKTMFKENPTETFIQFVEGLGEAGDEAGGILHDLGLGTVQTLRALLNASSAGDLLRDRVEAANAAWEDGTALTEEVSKRYATLTSHIIIFNNRFRNTISLIFDDFIPVVGTAIDYLGEFIMLLGTNVREFEVGASLVVADTLPDIQEEVKRILEPVQGVIDNISENWEITFDPVESFRAFMEGLLEFLEGIDLTDEMQVVQDYLDIFHDEGLTGFINATVPSLLDALGEVSTFAKNAYTDLSSLVSAVTTPISSVNLRELIDSGFGELATVLGYINDNWEVFRAGIIGIGVAITGAGTVAIIGSLAGALWGLVTPLNVLIGVGAGLGVAWQTNWLGIQDTTKSVIDQIGPPITTLGEDLGNMATAVSNLFTTISQTTDPEAVATTLGSLGDALGGIAGISIEGVDAVVRTLTDIANIIAEYRRLASETDTETDDIKNMVNGVVVPLLEVDVERLSTVGQQLENSKDSLFDLINIVRASSGVVFNLEFIQGFWDLGAALASLVLPMETIKPLLQGFGVDVGNLTPTSFVISMLTGVVTDFTSKAVEFRVGVHLFTELIKAIKDVTSGGLFPLVADSDRNGMDDFNQGLKTISDTVGGIDFSKITDFLMTPISLPIPSTVEFTVWLVQITEQIRLALVDAFDLSKIEINFPVTTSLVQSLIDIPAQIKTAFVDAFDLGEIPTQIKTAFADAFDLSTLELNFPITTSLVQWLIDVPDQIKTTFADAFDLSTIEMNFPMTTALFEWLIEVPGQIKTAFTNVLQDVDWGWPSIEDVVQVFTNIKNAIIDVLSGVFGEVPLIGDTGFTIGSLFGDVDAKDQGDQIAEDVLLGLTTGMSARETDAEDSGLTFAERFVKGFKEFFGIESPSTLMYALAQDIIAGLINGLEEIAGLNAAIEALRFVYTSLYGTIREEMNLFSTETVPEVVGVLQNDLIPTKQLLAEVINVEVIPAVSQLRIEEYDLGDAFGFITGKIGEQIDELKDYKDTILKLIPELEKVATAFENIATAMDKVNTPTISAPSTPTEPTGSAPFQEGGSFIVPGTSQIPEQLRGPTGGLMIEVHPNEFVQVLSSGVVSQLRQLPMIMRARLAETSSTARQPDISGAAISNSIENDNSTQNATYNLNVTEVVSPNVRDSFNLMRALAGAT